MLDCPTIGQFDVFGQLATLDCPTVGQLVQLCSIVGQNVSIFYILKLILPYVWGSICPTEGNLSDSTAIRAIHFLDPCPTEDLCASSHSSLGTLATM